MQNQSTFQVYNASAGSGKTFTLVKEYLKVILSSVDIYHFQKILAITFTNKAAGEMKERVLKNLHAFSEGQDNDLLDAIATETNIDKLQLKNKSKRILDAILQNYSAFSITTIDSFTHKIIKSFAYDLGLPMNFEVEMDAISLLNEAVDLLISKIGIDNDLTRLLIDFSLDKVDDDKSWDVSRELSEFAKILLNEDDVKHFRKLSDKTLDNFYNLKIKLQKITIQIERDFKKIADDTLSFIANHRLSESDFGYAGEYPKHFKKLQNIRYLKPETIKFDGRLNKTIEEHKKLYAAKTLDTEKDIIDGLTTDFHQFYYQSKEFFDQNYSHYLLCRLIQKNIIPLAVLNSINSELTVLKDDNNLRLNSEFNQLISDTIKDQPAPFIYERIGQQFMHYFIDEMQDTSVLQWQNLIPLIDNALAQEKSSLLLVGDGKQAIYRWRGGKAEQFIELGADKNPFNSFKQIQTLETNYRSYSEIINFNNHFFQHLSGFIQNVDYKQLFIDGNKQLENSKKGGFVTLNFVEEEEDAEENKQRYANAVLKKINDLKSDFSLNEICVLVRTKKEGITIASFLSEHGVNIISSETLLLQNNSKVNVIINLLQVLQQPEDKEALLDVLYFLHTHLQLTIDKHQFISEYIKYPLNDVFKRLENYQVFFDYSSFFELPFYEKIEEIIRSFKLINSSDAYVQFFLDIALEQQVKGVDIQRFLMYWERKKESLSIVAQEASNAVQIMTIHKSKGLEFPVVIVPGNIDVYKQINPTAWIKGLPETFEGFDEFYVDAGSKIQHVNDEGAKIYQQQREELELDNFNLLYVALTRPIEQLHVITEYKKPKSKTENGLKSSTVFSDYLKAVGVWNEHQFTYSFGSPKRESKRAVEVSDKVVEQETFISNSWKSHQIHLLANASKLWDTKQGEAIEFGNLIHEMMSKIVVHTDVDLVINQYLQQGIISKNDSKSIETTIKSIVEHPKLKPYFSEKVNVFNERAIATDSNHLIIPDRLVFDKDKSVIIIDYKTGKPSKTYHQQLLKYAEVLSVMGYKIKQKLLVYIDKTISIDLV